MIDVSPPVCSILARFDFLFIAAVYKAKDHVNTISIAVTVFSALQLGLFYDFSG